ncbi:TolC family protein [bacterium]|nr:TolC family protein [bacterium]
MKTKIFCRKVVPLYFKTIFLSLFLFVATLSFFIQAENIPTTDTSQNIENAPLEITVENAIIAALLNNRSLKVEQYVPHIKSTYEEEEMSKFDPVVSAGFNASRQKVRTKTKPAGNVSSGLTNLNVGVERSLPSGTQVSAGITLGRDWSDLYSDQYTADLGFTVTKALLQGAGLDFNMANVRQAKLDTLVSEYELRGFTEDLVASVETTYWNYALALSQIEIYNNSLQLAEQQLKETEERINVGELAEIELSAAQAEVALRKESLINAQSSLESVKLKLLRLINSTGDLSLAQEITLKNMPSVPFVKLDNVESHFELALKMRSDINQALLDIKKGDIEIVKTKNGLLPKLDFFVNLGKTGYANSFGNSIQDIPGRRYDVSAGVMFEWPVDNRQAESKYKRARLSRQQTEEALNNLSQLVEMDVRLAYIEVNRVAKQIEAIQATLKLQEEKVHAETEKFKVGRSTPLLVAQVQRDLLNAQISEVQAIVGYLNSLVELFRIEGSILERRGVQVTKF